MTTTFNNQYTAASLYDGGWRAEDRDQLIDEYQLTEEEADEICLAHVRCHVHRLNDVVVVIFCHPVSCECLKFMLHHGVCPSFICVPFLFYYTTNVVLVNLGKVHKDVLRL